MANKTEKSQTEKRLVGAVVPVGALRGKDSVGVGEFLDLVEFAALCKDMGIGLIQLLPVNDTGYESSPYSALSAFALNPIYIKIAEMREAAGFEARINKIRTKFDGSERFPYQDLIKAKIALLREIFTKKSGEIEKSNGLKNWIDANQWIKEYAVFRRLKELNELRAWKEWKSFNTVSKKDIETLWNDSKFASEHLFWAWVQFNLDAQFLKAKEKIQGLGLLLEGDLPILINEDSADVWAHPEFFNNHFSAGAPPDMYSPEGQNWGFPIYNWDALAQDDYSWWKQRLVCAEKYFDAYRIDHVLGFFRIWAASRANNTGLLGRFIPSVPINQSDLRELGFDEGRIRWMSLPHIPTRDLEEFVFNGSANKDDLSAFCESALERIGNEELWLFKKTITGEKDIESFKINETGKKYLLRAWNNRIFEEYDKENYSPLWYYHDSRAWGSLSEQEKKELEALIERKHLESEKKWKTEGEKILSVLKESSEMLPCAEDLGEVPECVPAVLSALKILGLRVVRWTRRWDEPGSPYVPFFDYPELSVCTPAVHDSSTVREWWDKEADQDLFASFTGCPTLSKIYNPGTAWYILKHAASAASRFRVFQIQDLLHLSPKWYAKDSASERINVPGTTNDFNWTYRLPEKISEIAKDDELIRRVQELCAVKPEVNTKKTC
ncbi:MAG: 4-alpha-glucanotransferase [Spirochaetaceae bacterium]|jgi:4-alpha-glucanotransferase|nr:4-alpha-glucanotransferase [Spirochaetaceae bacterium]